VIETKKNQNFVAQVLEYVQVISFEPPRRVECPKETSFFRLKKIAVIFGGTILNF